MDKASKTRTTAEDTSGDELFKVTREVVVGAVRHGSGRHTPQEAALLIIGRDLADGNEGTYRFPGPHENTTYTVNVELRGN